MEAAEPGAMLWSLTIHHLWEATVFAGSIGLLVVTWRRGSARLRHGLLLLASVKFLVPSFLLGWLAVRLEVAGWLVRGFEKVLPEPLSAWLPAAAGGPEGLGTAPPGAWLLTLSGVWALGVAACAVRWRGQRRELRRLVARSRPVEGAPAQRFTALQARLGLGRRVRLVASETLREPAVCGIVRPILLLPAGIGAHLSDDELDAVLLHELVHVRRRDNLTATAVRALCCLFWFHPLTWWLERRLLAEREQIVDEQVVAMAGGPKSYARGLLKVVRFGLGLQPVGVSSAGAGRLAERIERILAPSTSQAAGRVRRGLGIAGVGALVLFSLLPLPRSLCPTLLAEQDPARFVHSAPQDSPPPSSVRTRPESDCAG